MNRELSGGGHEFRAESMKKTLSRETGAFQAVLLPAAPFTGPSFLLAQDSLAGQLRAGALVP